MTAYAQAGGMASWIFIVFDHNEHELSIAQEHAKKLGFQFATRTGMRNSMYEWVAKIKRKDEKEKKVITEEVVITTTGEKEHSKVKEFVELVKFINTSTETGNVDENKKKEILDSIVCKMVHEGEIFIASNQTLWPCCFLWDSMVQDDYKIREKLFEFGPNWNSLKSNSLDTLLNHPYYNEILELSWEPFHKQHLNRCIKTCANKKAYQNEIKFK